MKGAVDQEGYEQIMASARRTQEAFDAGQFAQATSLWGQTEYVIMQVAHNVDFYNILERIPSQGTKNHICRKQLVYKIKCSNLVVFSKTF